MAANFKVAGKVKSGDYFTAKLPDSVTGNGDVITLTRIIRCQLQILKVRMAML